MKTIVAISTAPMTSAIGIVRISGDRAFEITEKVFSKPLSNVDGYRVVYGKIYDGKKVLDTVLATVFALPTVIREKIPLNFRATEAHIF